MVFRSSWRDYLPQVRGVIMSLEEMCYYAIGAVMRDEYMSMYEGT